MSLNKNINLGINDTTPVSILTATPGQALHVVGSANISASLCIMVM